MSDTRTSGETPNFSELAKRLARGYILALGANNPLIDDINSFLVSSRPESSLIGKHHDELMVLVKQEVTNLKVLAKTALEGYRVQVSETPNLTLEAYVVSLTDDGYTPENRPTIVLMVKHRLQQERKKAA